MLTRSSGTYTNLENHPRLIKARSDRPERSATPKAKQIRIELDPRTGLPRVATDDRSKLSTVEPVEPGERRKAAVGRPKGETPEEKRLRKQAVKEGRQVMDFATKPRPASSPLHEMSGSTSRETGRQRGILKRALASNQSAGRKARWYTEIMRCLTKCT